jgi:hypothetical protein
VAIGVQFLKELQAANYRGRIIFYETFEAEADFDNDNIIPNVVYTFGNEKAAGKARLINMFESQTYRRDYSGLATARDQKNYAHEIKRRDGKSDSVLSAERFVVGSLMRSPRMIDDGFGRWPFLHTLYSYVGDGFMGLVALPVVVESVLPAVGLSWAGVSSPAILIGVQILWQLLHGSEGLTLDKTLSSVATGSFLLAITNGFGAEAPNMLFLALAYAAPHLVLNVTAFSNMEERLAGDLVDEMAARANGQPDAQRSERLAKNLSRAFPLGFELGKLYTTESRHFNQTLFQSWLEKKLAEKGLARTTIEAALNNNKDSDLIVVPIYDGLPVEEFEAIITALDAASYNSKRTVAFVGETGDHRLNDLMQSYLSRTRRAARYHSVGMVMTDQTGAVSLNLPVLERALGGLLLGSTGVQFLIGGAIDVRADGLNKDSLLMKAVFSILSEDLKVISMGISQLNAMKEIARLISSQA